MYCKIYSSQNIPISIRRKFEATEETNAQQDGNTSNQPAKSDQEFFEELDRKFQEQMIQSPETTGHQGEAAADNTSQQQKDPTETDDEGTETQAVNRKPF